MLEDTVGIRIDGIEIDNEDIQGMEIEYHQDSYGENYVRFDIDLYNGLNINGTSQNVKFELIKEVKTREVIEL